MFDHVVWTALCKRVLETQDWRAVKMAAKISLAKTLRDRRVKAATPHVPQDPPESP